MQDTRCINIDWLEVYCLEDSIGYPHNADYFRRCGLHVVQRDYGTPIYHEMFTIFGNDNQPLLEVRRNPKSQIGLQEHGVLDPNACHVRLCNRTCYFNEPAKLLQQFLETYGLHYQRISRIDICLDFVKFDFGDDPAEFMRRYMAGRYSKINQANISAHGTDQWHGRIWNSVSWGNPKSMVSTKFYNKKLELTQVHDKPYIRQAWRAAGLVDDELTLTKFDADGNPTQPDIWRVEFSIKSGTRNWFRIEDQHRGGKPLSVKHNLQMYSTREDYLNVFLSLADHYFHFKKFEPDKRKDRCADKLTFNTKKHRVFYKLENVATKDEPAKRLHNLYAKIVEYRDSHPMPQIYNACNVILADLELSMRTTSLVKPWPLDEVAIIRNVIARRIHSHDKPLNQDIAEERMVLNLTRQIFADESP